MKPMRVYVDTSVFGGCFDVEFAETSRAFFEAIFGGTVVALVSDTLIAELIGAPDDVRQLLDRVRRTDCELLEYGDETADLQRAYLRAGILPARYGGDALHVAYATLARADMLVSWNFKHLVNPLRERAFNGVNLANGYGLVSIVTPTEVVKMLEVNDEAEQE